MSAQADVNLSNFNAIQANTGAIADLTSSVQAEVTRAIAAESAIVGDISSIVKNMCDTQMSSTSTNPVQNKVVKAALDGKLSREDIATVATTGSYNDLKDKPSIPSSWTVDAALSPTSTNPVQNKVIKANLDLKAVDASLAVVAKTGSYNDLLNKPTITNGFTLSTITATGSAWRLYVTAYTETGGTLTGVTGTLYKVVDGIDTGTGRVFTNSLVTSWQEDTTNYKAAISPDADTSGKAGRVMVKSWDSGEEPVTGDVVIAGWWTSGMDVTTDVQNEVDRTPTVNRTHNLVTSGGVYSAVTGLDSRITSLSTQYTTLNASLTAIQADVTYLSNALTALNGE